MNKVLRGQRIYVLFGNNGLDREDHRYWMVGIFEKYENVKSLKRECEKAIAQKRKMYEELELNRDCINNTQWERSVRKIKQFPIPDREAYNDMSLSCKWKIQTVTIR